MLHDTVRGRLTSYWLAACSIKKLPYLALAKAGSV